MTRPLEVDGPQSSTRARPALGQGKHPRFWLVREVLPMASVAFAFAAVQIRFLRVPDIGDQADYFNTAFDFPDVSLSHRHARTGLLLPVRALQEAFGFSEVAYYAVPILAGILFSVATYLLGRLLFNQAVGLGAGTLVLLNPYMMRDSSYLLPDIPAAAMFTWAIVLLVFAGRRLRRQIPQPDWRIRLLLIGAGALLGWSYLTREFTVLFFPLVLVSFWAFRIRWRLLTYVAGAALATLAIELIAAQIAWDNPFARFDTVLGRRASAATQASRWGPIDSLLLLPRVILDDPVGPFFVALLVLVAIGAVLQRDRESVLLATWTYGMWAFFLLISHKSAFDVIHLFSGGEAAFVSLRFEKIRYWSPIWPAIAVGGLGGILSVYRWAAGARSKGPESRSDGKRVAFTVGAGLAVLLMATMTLGVGLNQVQGWTPWWIADESTHYDEFRMWLDEHGASHDRIWTDRFTARVLPIYTSEPLGDPIWRGDILSYNAAREWLPEQELESGIVVIHSGSLSRTREQALPLYAIEPPDTWKRLAEIGTLTIYEITSS